MVALHGLAALALAGLIWKNPIWDPIEYPFNNKGDNADSDKNATNLYNRKAARFLPLQCIEPRMISDFKLRELQVVIQLSDFVWIDRGPIFGLHQYL